MPRQKWTDVIDALNTIDTDEVCDINVIDGGARSAPESTSPHVLNLDRWGQHRGRHILENWHGKGILDDEGNEDHWSNQAHIIADAHGSLFESTPTLADNPADAHRAAWWKQLLDTPEYRSMRNETYLNSMLSEIGAKALYDKWTQYAKECPPPEDGEPAPGSDEESIEQTMKRIRSCASAAKECAADVQEAKDATAGLGLGDGSGNVDPQAVRQYLDRVRNNAQLKAIMEMAGRMRTLSQALQRTKASHGRDDVVGIELGGDVSRLVPSELGQLSCGIPELELLALDRVARKQALCRRYHGIEKLGKGPIIVCVDESSSMNGSRIVAAKALALALAGLARAQRRWIALVGFSKGPHGNAVSFAPGQIDQPVLIDWLEHMYDGGTTLDVPLRTVRDNYWSQFVARGMPTGKTDMIVITDANVEANEALRESYMTWAKAERVYTYGIIVGTSNAGDLGSVCDRHWCIPSLNLDSEAVEGVLSI